MTAAKLPPNSETAYILSRFFLVRHIYAAVDEKLKDIFSIHRLLTKVENGDCPVFCGYNDNGDIAGVCYGEMEGEYFCVHVMFDRNIDAVSYSRLFEKLIKEHYVSNDIPFKGIIGCPAVSNRAALLFCKKMGYKEIGFSDKVLIKDNEEIPCRLFRKEF